jgi:DNA repair exonuclease SbcCD nuclease subunit
MKAILTADLHLTARQQDEYRWHTLDWIIRKALQRDVDVLIIAGDLTDEKDFHSAALVNRLTSVLVDAASKVLPIRVLKGNHDYTDPKCPFFDFLNHTGQDIRYISYPEREIIGAAGSVIYLPHSDRPQKHWHSLETKEATLVVIHQCFTGAQLGDVSNPLVGTPPKLVTDHFQADYYIAGDIHLPQEVGGIIYCGSPHPINFGETHHPHILFYDHGELKEIPNNETVKKATVRLDAADSPDFDASALGIFPKDHVKIVVQVSVKDLHKWDALRAKLVKQTTDQEVQLFGIEMTQPKEVSNSYLTNRHVTVANNPRRVLERFAQHKDIDAKMLKVGLELAGFTD